MKTLTRFAASIAICGLSGIGMAQESDDIFQNLDKNGDGILVGDEIPEAQQRFFERLVRAGDKNEDGKLSKAEYQATLKEDERPAGAPDGNRPDGPGRGRGMFEPGAMFDRMDANKDGKLERSELPEFAAQRMGRIFDELKKDAIDKEEYAKAMQSMMQAGGRPGGRSGISEFFEQLDKNKDGKLSKDELPPQMQERLASLFDRLGTDSISLEQLAEMRQQRERDRPTDGSPEEGREREMRRESGPDRPREGRPERDGDRPEMRERDRGEGRPGPGPGGPGRGPAFIGILDEDGNGKISKAEAINIAKLFAELDHNQDGELDAPELMGFPGRPGPEDGERGRFGMERREGGDRPERRREGDRPEAGRSGFGPEAILQRFDENKDGAISKDEAPDRMAQNFERLDANGDGKITADEFGRMFGGPRPGSREDGRPAEGGRRPEGDRPGRPQRPEAE